MATWVGLFVNNLDKNSVRKLEVKASSEVDALVMLDLYEYDETWQQYSFFSIYKKKGGINTMLVYLKEYWTQIIATIGYSQSGSQIKNQGGYAYMDRHPKSMQ